MSSSASEVDGAIFVPVDGAGLTPTDPSVGLSDFDELGMKVIKAGNMTSVIALHHGYGLEAATTQQDPATFWGSNLFGDLVLLANVQFSSPTLAMLLQQEDGKRWRSCMPSGLCTKVVFNKDVAPIDLMRLVPVVEAFLLLGAETTPLPFMMATLALACLVLAARPARTLASIAGSPPMGAGAVSSRSVSSRASAQPGSVGRFGAAPRHARIIFLLMAFASLGITSAKSPPPMPPLPLPSPPSHLSPPSPLSPSLPPPFSPPLPPAQPVWYVEPQGRRRYPPPRDYAHDLQPGGHPTAFAPPNCSAPGWVGCVAMPRPARAMPAAGGWQALA